MYGCGSTDWRIHCNCTCPKRPTRRNQKMRIVLLLLTTLVGRATGKLECYEIFVCEMELRVTPLPLLQSSGNRPGVEEKRVGCKTAHPSPRKKQRVEEPPSCLSPPSLEATPEHILPGYRLRSRHVDFWEMAPKRRRSSSDSKVAPH